MVPSTVWGGVWEAQRGEKLLKRTAVVLWQMLRRRCGSCPETKSESGRGEAEGEEGEGQ